MSSKSRGESGAPGPSCISLSCIISHLVYVKFHKASGYFKQPDLSCTDPDEARVLQV